MLKKKKIVYYCGNCYRSFVWDCIHNSVWDSVRDSVWEPVGFLAFSIVGDAYFPVKESINKNVQQLICTKMRSIV